MDISLFEDDWKECLRAHYDYVVREHDDNNEESLITVLLQTGFSDEDIALMRTEIEASLEGEDNAEYEAVAEAEFEPAEVIEVASEFIEAPAASDVAGGELFEPAVAAEVPETLEASQTLEAPDVLEIPEESDQAPMPSEDEPPEPENFTQMSMF